MSEKRVEILPLDGVNEDIKHDSEPAKHLYENSDHKFTRSIISTAPKLLKKQEIF